MAERIFWGQKKKFSLQFYVWHNDFLKFDKELNLKLNKRNKGTNKRIKWIMQKGTPIQLMVGSGIAKSRLWPNSSRVINHTQIFCFFSSGLFY
jgi:hypothetical protein